METIFLNQIELATRWGISRRTLEKWRWLGKGPRYFKLSNRIRYSVADIELFEASNFLNHTTEEYQKIQDAKHVK